MDGFALLTWILGGCFLYLTVIIANALHGEPNEVDAHCAAVDAELDAREEFDAWMRREARI
jgi:hypothetical protein